MNERYIEALKKLKENLDDLKIDFKAFQKEITSKEDNNLQKIMFKVADDLAKYDIKDGYWYYNGKNTGVKAEAKDGKDGEQGPQGIQGPVGPTGKPGKDGKDGKPGKDGKDGKPGKDGKSGKDGKPGKDGETPNFKVKKVYLDSEGQAKVSMEKEGNTYYLTFTIPQGVQGVMGFPGEDATINGKNAINIIPGNNISLEQDDKGNISINSLVNPFELKIVDILPTENISSSAIYFVPTSDPNDNNIFEEYVYVNEGTEDNPKWDWELLGTTKVDLSNYVKNTDIATTSKAGIVKVGDGLTTSLGYLVIARASNAMIDAKTNQNYPIVPANLDYAVKSVVGGHVTLTQAEYDALETKDENTYYNIVEE